jgi:hypothetical protein
MERKLTDELFIVTGNVPLEERAIERIVSLEGGVLDESTVWPEALIIVIGREYVDRDFLLQSIQARHDYGFDYPYISQEAFFEFWLDGVLPAYYEGDPRIENHEGLSFLASIGFKWPTINEVQGRGTLDSAKNWNEKSILRLKFGYSVRKGLSEKTRRKRLAAAVSATDVVGLHVAAEHIAFLIRLNQGKADPLLESALERWRSDLDWLYNTYYENSAYRFSWPTY